MKKLVPALVVAALIFSGCGGSDGGGSSEDEAQIRDLVNKAADLMQDKDYEGYCALLSPDATAQIENAEGIGDQDCESIMAFAGNMVSDEEIDEIRNPESIDVDGDTATVTYGGDKVDDNLTVERVDGEWMLGLGVSASTSEDEGSS